MVDLAAADITTTLAVQDIHRLGKIKMAMAALSFGDSAKTYPYGGIPLPDKSIFGMNKELRELQVNGPPGTAGAQYRWVYDRTNHKLKAMARAPAIVIEEKHTAVANLITLDYPAAWIVCVTQAGQNMAWGKSQAAASLAANSFCVVGTIADGVRTQIYTDGATDTVYVTYVTQAWKELYDCLVQEEAVTLATGANNLANTLLGIGFVEAATTGILLPVDIADTTASGEVGVKHNFATGALDINVAQNTEAAVVTYLKKPTAGFIVDRYIADEDPAKAGADPYTQTFDRPMLLWLCGAYAYVNGGATQVFIEEDATPAAGEINTNWCNPGPLGTGAAPAAGAVIACKSNVTVTAGSYIFGHPWEIPGLSDLELKDGTVIDSTSLDVMAWGK